MENMKLIAMFVIENIMAGAQEILKNATAAI